MPLIPAKPIINYLPHSWASANLLGGGCFGIMIQLMLWLRLDKPLISASPMIFWLLQALALAMVPGFQALVLRQNHLIRPWRWFLVSWAGLLIPQILLMVFSSFFLSFESFYRQGFFVGILTASFFTLFFPSLQTFIMLFMSIFTVNIISFWQIKSQMQLKSAVAWLWVWQNLVGQVLGDALVVTLGFCLIVIIEILNSIFKIPPLIPHWLSNSAAIIPPISFFAVRQWFYALWTAKMIEQLG
jgi:hypothetical protein